MKLDELLQIESFQIGDKTFEANLEEDLDINSSNLDYEFCRHPKIMATHGFAYEQALAHQNRLEVDLDRLYAFIDHDIRTNAQLAGEKVTEKAIENRVKMSEKYAELQNRLLSAQEQTGLLKAAKQAIEHKQSMLIQIGSLEKALINSNPSMRG